MLAARLVEPGRVVVDDVAPPPAPTDGEVLVRTRMASVCGSDRHVVDLGFGVADYPAPPGFPGHESVGDVDISRHPDFAAGDRVLCVPPAAEGRAFAERQVLAGAQLVALPADAPDEFVLAQQYGTVLFAARRFWPFAEPGTTALVLGAGPAGLLFTHWLRRGGFSTVVVADRRPQRLALATAFGASRTVDVAAADPVAVTAEHSDGRGADLVVEAAGTDRARAVAAGCVARDGRIGAYGLPERAGGAGLPYETLLRARVTLLTSSNAQAEPGLWPFLAAIAALQQGEVDPAAILTEALPLKAVAEGFDRLRRPQDPVIKLGLRCQ